MITITEEKEFNKQLLLFIFDQLLLFIKSLFLCYGYHDLAVIKSIVKDWRDLRLHHFRYFHVHSAHLFTLTVGKSAIIKRTDMHLYERTSLWIKIVKQQ